MKPPIHCAWCGKDFPATHKDRPKQHKNGNTTCIGSGQKRETHDQLSRVKEHKK